MNIDIRKSIHNNFTNTNEQELRDSIESYSMENDEITLPGLGVFFEIVWKKSNQTVKDELLHYLVQEFSK